MRNNNQIIWKAKRIHPADRREVLETRGCAPCAGTGHVVLADDSALCPECNGRGWVFAPATPVKLEFEI